MQFSEIKWKSSLTLSIISRQEHHNRASRQLVSSNP